jgi:F0F1-type ATP synthase membrane subunit c/vacuolar-type H+-ATPase subunit K
MGEVMSLFAIVIAGMIGAVVLIGVAIALINKFAD